jgi:hypothetical protein
MQLRYNHDMAESEKTTPRATTPTNSLGLKSFNATGRDETTTNIIKIKQDPKRTLRNVGLVAVIIVAFVIASIITFQRSGLKLDEIFSEEHGPSFGGPRQEQQKFDD